jgi:excisionase family DNA binding protein
VASDTAGHAGAACASGEYVQVTAVQLAPGVQPGSPSREPSVPSLERMAHLTLLAWELALASEARNGHPLPADVRWCVQRLALADPLTAARCPQVRRALPPDVRAAVLALAAAPVTAPAGQASQPSGSEAGPEWLTVQEAAQALGVSAHGVRAACRRGRLDATRGPAGWRIRAASVQEYRRRQCAA